MTVSVEQHEGFILLDKPAGMTSFACVKHIRKLCGTKIKVGHGGTLDSFASGLLIVGISRAATRHMNVLLKMDKQYQATGVLGGETETMDCTQPSIRTCPIDHITYEQLESVTMAMRGQYEQIPPIVSALKYKGSRLSDLLRSKRMTYEELAILTGHKKRAITLYNITVTSFTGTTFSLDVHVSHGTYIRALVSDIGYQVGSCAYTESLTRTAIGPFLLAQATPVLQLQSLEGLVEKIIAIDHFIACAQAHQVV